MRSSRLLDPRLANGGMCVDVLGGDSSSDTSMSLVQFPCDNSASQTWSWYGSNQDALRNWVACAREFPSTTVCCVR